jgi:itaconate CoA-transferase
MLGLQNDREWQVFCAKVLQQPELASDPRFDTNARRVATRDVLAAIIDEVFSRLSSEQVVQRLDDAQIANAHVNGMREVWAHPQLAARERWTEVASPAGAIRALEPPALPASFDARMDAIPALGQHTDAVLTEFGFDEATVARWRRDGVV